MEWRQPNQWRADRQEAACARETAAERGGFALSLRRIAGPPQVHRADHLRPWPSNQRSIGAEMAGYRFRLEDHRDPTPLVYRGDLSQEGGTKTEASNATLRLGPSMLYEFQQRYPGSHRSDEFLFLGDDGLLPPDDRDLLREEFRPVLKKLKLYYNGFGWHAFRRQNITWRQQVGGATPLEAQRAARHASLDMTYLYTLTDTERETAQQQAMFDQLAGPAGGLVTQ